MSLSEGPNGLIRGIAARCDRLATTCRIYQGVPTTMTVASSECFARSNLLQVTLGFEAGYTVNFVTVIVLYSVGTWLYWRWFHRGRGASHERPGAADRLSAIAARRMVPRCGTCSREVHVVELSCCRSAHGEPGGSRSRDRQAPSGRRHRSATGDPHRTRGRRPHGQPAAGYPAGRLRPQRTDEERGRRRTHGHLITGSDGAGR
jgi:hypothetical protein